MIYPAVTSTRNKLTDMQHTRDSPVNGIEESVGSMITFRRLRYSIASKKPRNGY